MAPSTTAADEAFATTPGPEYRASKDHLRKRLRRIEGQVAAVARLMRRG